jgi:hypothetical protein
MAAGNKFPCREGFKIKKRSLKKMELLIVIAPILIVFVVGYVIISI